MIHDHRSAISVTLLLLLPACSGTDDPFSEGGRDSGVSDAGEPAARGGSSAAPDGGTTGGRTGYRGGASGTSGTDTGGGGDGDAGDDDPDAGTGGMVDPGGGASSGGIGGSCHRAGSGGCGHARGGMSGSGGGGGVGCNGAGGCGHAGSGMSGSGAGGGGGAGCTGSGAGSGGCGHDAAGAGGVAGMGGAGGAPALVVGAELYPFSCDRSHPFEVHHVAYESGALVKNYTCEWTFDGGGTSQSCAGTHTFSTGGFQGAMVVVRDTSTGASGIVTTPKFLIVDPLALTITAEAPKCGLTIWYVTTRTGGRGRGFTNILVTPFENVLTPGPLPPSGTFDVSAPGTYELRVLHEEETTGPICEAEDSTEVVVNACP